MSVLQNQQQPSQPSITQQTPPSEIASTTDALAQLRLKRREEASGSSEPKATKGQTVQDLEAEAAPFEEVQEEAIPEKRGAAGMTFAFSLPLSLLFFTYRSPEKQTVVFALQNNVFLLSFEFSRYIEKCAYKFHSAGGSAQQRCV